MQRNHPSRMPRWLYLAVSGLALFIGSCGSLLYIFGNGTSPRDAHLTGQALSTVEVTELVGTTNYRQSSGSTSPSLLHGAMQALRVPFASISDMLMSQLPSVDTASGSMLPNQIGSYPSAQTGPVVRTTQAPSHNTSPQHATPVNTAATTQNTQVSANPSSSAVPTANESTKSISSWESSTRKIALGWIPYTDSSSTIAMIQQNPGMTVVSPKWMTVWSGTGILHDSTESSVVDYAHQHHIKVWPLLDNQFDSALTHQLLSSKRHEDYLISQIVTAVKREHLDGINVDFENVLSSDQNNYTQFIQELHAKLHQVGAVLSVDVTPDIQFLKDDAAFFHAGLAQYCDYVVLMSYDEHWGGDPTPGPVADVPWVEQSVYDLLNTGVAANQLILGIPFYTQFWYVHQNGSVTSEAIGVSDVQSILQSHHATGSWQPSLGVSYARYPKPNGYMEVWYETTKTLQMKLQLVNNEGLAGVAVWSLALSNRSTWTNLMQVLRQSLS